MGPKRFNTFRKLSVLEMPGGGLILYNQNRVFIPTRKDMLDILHQFHFATARMTATAKAYIFWLNMKQDIDTRYKSCAVCATEQKARDLSTPI